MLSPRSIAVQGLAFGTLHTALQGLVVLVVPEPPVQQTGRRPPARMPVPFDLAAARRAQLIDEDEFLILMAAQIAAAGLLH